MTKEQKMIKYLESRNYKVNEYQVWQAENNANIFECSVHFGIPIHEMFRLLREMPVKM